MIPEEAEESLRKVLDNFINDEIKPLTPEEIASNVTKILNIELIPGSTSISKDGTLNFDYLMTFTEPYIRATYHIERKRFWWVGWPFRVLKRKIKGIFAKKENQ